jgi:hypothetical protein
MSNSEFKVDLAQNRSGAELMKGRVCRAAHANAARFKPGTLALDSESRASGYRGSGLMTWLYASEGGYSRDKKQPASCIAD